MGTMENGHRPISYNFASRSSRPVGYSLMYPLPPSS